MAEARQPSLATSGSIFDDEEHKKAHVREEGKKWAEFVTPENAWQKLVLTLGKLSMCFSNRNPERGGQLKSHTQDY